MVLFNYSTKEITAKIVYYGPGLCGKTTNLQFIYENLPGTINKGKMLSLATKTDRTLFFDFLPIDLGTIRGMHTRLQLYTVPGQVFYNTTRKLVLKGADGVVFVADSQKRMVDANIESFKNLEENLAEHDMKLAEMPLIIQFNKRDLPDVCTPDELNASLNRFNSPIYEAVATTGIGVHETLKAITRLVLNSLREKYADKREAQRPEAPQMAAAAARAAARTPSPSQPSLEDPFDIPHAAPPAPPPPAAAHPAPPPRQAPVYEMGSGDSTEVEMAPVQPAAFPEPYAESPETPLSLDSLDPDVPLIEATGENVLEVISDLEEPPLELGASFEPEVQSDAPFSIGDDEVLELADETGGLTLDEPTSAPDGPLQAQEPHVESEEIWSEPLSAAEPSMDAAASMHELDLAPVTDEFAAVSPPDLGSIPLEAVAQVDEEMILEDGFTPPPASRPASTPGPAIRTITMGGSSRPEIQLPVRLAIGDKTIQFDLRISLDLSALENAGGPAGGGRTR